jgi:septal ring-binding cell division protein DamX
VAEAELQLYLLRTQTLLKTTDLTRYTLQIAAISEDASAASYLRFASQHVNLGLVYAKLSTYNGRNFVSVYYGSYGTLAEATAALAGLPDALKFNKPIVRTWARIKQDQAL